MARLRVRQASPGVEDGFTLVEVLVALMLMSLVLMAGAGFIIRSMNASSAMGGRQDAVTVANQVLEQIRAVDPTFVSGVSPLVLGRGQAQVTAQWVALAAAGFTVAKTYTGSGTTTFDAHTYQTASGSPTVPLQQSIVFGGQTYTVDSLIGTCLREPVAGTECTTGLSSGDELFRVVVRVTWKPSTGQNCPTATTTSLCSYMASTLIDPTIEPQFNSNRKPLANADTATTPAATPVSIGVTANDSGDFPLAGAVTILTSPANGTLSDTNNIITYTPSAGFSGTNQFTYTVTDLTDRTSTAATVTITVTPVGVADTGTTTTGTATTLSVAVLANDKGTGLSLVSLTAPAIGSAVISGTNIVYTPPASASGTATITYTAKDSSAQQYTATLTITVKPTVSTTVTTGTCWAGWAKVAGVTTKSVTLPTTAFLGTGPFTISAPALVSGPAGATVSRSGSTLTYALPSQTVVPQSITYTVTDASGLVSASITMTLKGTCP